MRLPPGRPMREALSQIARTALYDLGDLSDYAGQADFVIHDFQEGLALLQLLVDKKPG